MKILLIDQLAGFLDFGLRCEADGHEVKLWLPKDKFGNKIKIGDGLLKKVENYEFHMSWADLILTSDNISQINQLEKYRKQGFPIFGANAEVTAWELDRDRGQEILESHGIACLPTVRFKTYDEGIAFQMANKETRYVCKPIGDAPKEYSYVSKSFKDMIFMLSKWKKLGMSYEFVMQEFTPGIEMAVGGWMGRDGFAGHFLENFEFKKLMNGECGPNCYSEDTEVLTREGWKFFNAVSLQDDFASYDPVTNKSFFEKATKLHWTKHTGPMHSFKNRYSDLLVTASHNMYVARRKTTAYKIVSADSCPGEFSMLQVGMSTEPDLKQFVLSDGTSIPGDAYMAFMGWYLAEGHTNPDRPRVSVSQNPGPKQDLMVRALNATGLSWNVSGNRATITHKALHAYTRQFGLQVDRFIPPEIVGASARQIDIFLEAFNLGDGDNHFGRRRYCSGSIVMIGQIQAMMHFIGKTGVIYADTRTTMVSPLNGKTYNALPVYSVEEASREKCDIRKKDKSVIHYDGMIGCVTLPTTHLLVVRRNGKIAISGNTGEQGTAMRYVTLEESKLAQAVLAPLEAALIRSGYTGYIDVAVIIDKKGNVCPLEFTSRLGWPLFQIQQVLHKDVAQWMLDLINGKDTFRPFTDTALGVVIAIPDYPYKHLKIEELCGYPIWGITDKNRYNIHPSDIMLGQGYGDDGLEDMMVTAGNNPVIVTGTGNGVCEAKDAAYETVKELEIPNSPMYRTDIGSRLEKQLEELQSMGYATSWNWE